jgi:vacuolar protein sorting-associated protein 8
VWHSHHVGSTAYLARLESVKGMEASTSHSVEAFLTEDTGILSNDEPDLSHAGDYSSHMEELFDEETEGSFHGSDSEEEGFIYHGADAVDTPAGYQERLWDVLGSDHNESEFDALEVEHSLVYDQHTGDEPLVSEYSGMPYFPPVTVLGHSLQQQHVDDIFSEDSPNSSSGPLTPPSPASYFKLARPFLHPTVSRLRSYTPQATRKIHDGSVASSHSHLFDGTSPSPSHFSSISRASSVSNLLTTSSAKQDASNSETIREVFRWTELQAVMQTIYLSPKASGLLGASSLGRPTVLAANGLICTGTDDGKVVVHDFKQSLICICESNVQGIFALCLMQEHTYLTSLLGSSPGAVTAIALSHDHTFVVSGHVTGYIILYNLKNPRNPVRSVPPTTLAAVSTGRKEGHLQGSKIINIGFVAGRHTAIVSADDHGLAFFHSLGKILFVEASDILRILGRYPDGSFPRASLKTPLLSSSIPAFSPMVNGHQKRKTRYTVLAMSPLPLGTAPHATDSYQAVALLTPTKLVVIGLKPSPRTWFKCPREVDEGGSWRSGSKWMGSMAWFPCVTRSSQSGAEMAQPGQIENSQNQNGLSTTPMLAYSWGRSLHILKVAESRIKQGVKNPTTGKATEIEVGTLTYERFEQWSADDDIISLQWLNANVGYGFACRKNTTLNFAILANHRRHL